MMRAFAYIGVVTLCSGAAFSQSTETPAAPPKFEVADVHASALSSTPYMNGPFLYAAQYQLKNASMVDLISTAYDVDADKVMGGPNWLEFDRFDVIAKTPPGSTAETRKLMLQSLLADRFKLVIHTDSKPFPAFSLTAGKNPKLKEADGTGDPGCRFSINGPPPQPGAGPAPLNVLLSCHSSSMQSFADSIRGMVSTSDVVIIGGRMNSPPVQDATELKGNWDFDLKFTLDPQGGSGSESAAIIEAMDKQLGLKLEPVKVPMPIIQVDHVNQKPTANSPDAIKSFPPPPTEFDVAEIKQSAPVPPPEPGGRRGARGPAFQNGRVNLQGYTLKQMITIAWNISGDDMLAGAPKWLDSDRFDIIAKAPDAVITSPATPGGRGAPIDVAVYRPMIQKLLIDKFKLAVHYEDRPVNTYVLSAVKPKLQKADPANRTRWWDGPSSDGKDPRKANPALGRLVQCQNMTMAQFASLLPSIAPGYRLITVQDTTGLEGAFDFTVNFSGAGLVNGGGRGPEPGAAAGGTPGSAAASDPSGGLSLADAISKQLGLKLEVQKRPMPVLVIDHIEPKPTEN